MAKRGRPRKNPSPEPQMVTADDAGASQEDRNFIQMPDTFSDDVDGIPSDVDDGREHSYDIKDPSEMVFDDDDSDDEGGTEVEGSEDAEGGDDADPAFDDDLLDRAEELGLTEEEALAFGEPALLEKVLDRMDRRAIRQDKLERQRAQQQEVRQQQEPDFKMELDIDEDTFDPELVKVINKMNDHYADKLKAFHESHNQLLAGVQEYASRELRQRLDSWFDDLGPEYEDVFGSGPSESLDQSSDEFHNRLELVAEMDAMATAKRGRGQNIGEQELFRRSVRSLYGDKIKAEARKEVTRNLKRKQGQYLHKASSPKSKRGLTPEEDAVKYVRDKLQEIGGRSRKRKAKDF